MKGPAGVSPREPVIVDVQSVEAPASRPAVSYRGRTSEPSPAIALHELRRCYGDVIALDGVSLMVAPGETVGVLGPNGAGKTSLLEIATGLRRPDSGTVELLGQRTSGRPSSALRARIGVATQKTALPELLTVGEILRLYASVYRAPRDTADLLERIHLVDKRDSQVRHLSGGQHQRLVTALAVIGEPDLLFLDEPTVGLDPQARLALWQLVRDTRPEAAERAVVLTTHQLDEAEDLCDRVVILDHGRVLDHGTPSALIERHAPGHAIHFETSLGTDLSSLSGDVHSTVRNRVRTAVMVRTHELERSMTELMRAREQGTLVVDRLAVERSSLEDVFLVLTGREMRDD
jgi:ABC-2 type transport system ATP-binding protein